MRLAVILQCFGSAAEDSGFEMLDVENLRPHYALTCRRWEQRLAAHRDAALLLVDEPTFRAWRLWLAASALSFEDGLSSVYQVLMSKRGAARRLLTRENMHSEPGPNERLIGHRAEASLHPESSA